MGAGYADIIFFAAVAVYLGIKLFSILGKRNEEDVNAEQKRANFRLPEGFPENQKLIQNVTPVVSLKPVVVNDLSKFKFTSDAAKAGIDEIIAVDKGFVIEDFVEGAKTALEMVLKAYSEGDKNSLKDLLADDVYKVFEAQLDDMKTRNLVNTKTLIAVDDVEITAAQIVSSRAKISLRFLTEQINIIKNSEGAIIHGDSKQIENVEDITHPIFHIFLLS